MSEPAILALAATAAFVGALGGLGGAILLVPALVVGGVPASEAAPLGLVAVAAGSLAAGPHQLAERAVNHRLGAVTELAASSGAVGGALLSGAVSDRVIAYVLAATAGAAAVVGVRRRGVRNPPDPACTAADVGERVGSLAGAYPVAGGVAPYVPVRPRAGLVAMGLSGILAGVAGTAGGFVKTPAMTELMYVPVKVAAATTTFTSGITASAALLVFALSGRLDAGGAAAVIVGGLLGGAVGARLQSRLRPVHVRRALALILVAVAVLLVVQA